MKTLQMTETKFEVWATVYDTEIEDQVKKLQGTFDSYMCAKLFKDAYNKHFSANAEIVEYRICKG